jgi:hypothetical protein
MKIEINITKKFMIIFTVVSLLVVGSIVYASSVYLYDSKEVRYDNTSTSVLTSATDVQTALDDLYSAAATYDLTAANSGFHNSIFRGKDVTEYLTSEYSLYDRISDGTFTDLYVGDYVVANGITWRIAGFDMLYNKGDSTDTSINQTYNRHHAVIVPDTNLTSAQMNTSDTTKGGYVGSAMYKTTLPTVLSTYITPVFGEHVLTYQAILTNSVNTSAYNRFGTNTGASNGWTWYIRSLDLMNENQVYGSIVWSSSGYEIGADNVQFPLFRLKPKFIVEGNKSRYWLRNVASSSLFAHVSYKGDSGANGNNASNSEGVRPCFYIG